MNIDLSPNQYHSAEDNNEAWDLRMLSFLSSSCRIKEMDFKIDSKQITSNYRTAGDRTLEFIFSCKI